MTTEENKAILKKGNAAIAEGNNEGFLSLCTDDTEWTFVGDKILTGKEAVRQWMAAEYVVPPQNRVAHMIAEDDFLTVTGYLTSKDKDGKVTDYEYCDIWRFEDGKIAALKAFVIKTETK